LVVVPRVFWALAPVRFVSWVQFRVVDASHFVAAVVAKSWSATRSTTSGVDVETAGAASADEVAEVEVCSLGVGEWVLRGG